LGAAIDTKEHGFEGAVNLIGSGVCSNDYNCVFRRTPEHVSFNLSLYIDVNLLIMKTINTHASHVQEIAFRESLINEWLAELDVCITWAMPRRTSDYILKLGELQLEVDKLHRWSSDISVIESVFLR
jgi:hypothetical protein